MENLQDKDSSLWERLQDRSLTRGEVLEISDEIEEMLGSQELLLNLELALDVDTLRDILGYIVRCFDLES